MKKLMIAAAAAFAAASAPSAMAQGFYADAGYSFVGIDVEEQGVSVDLDLGVIAGHAGYKFNENFAIEGELGFGVSDEEFSDGVNNASIGINYLLGVYGVGTLPVGENVELFGRVGVVQAEAEAELNGFSTSESETGFAAGVGADFTFGEGLYIRGEYTRYDIEELQADAFAIGIGYRFNTGS